MPNRSKPRKPAEKSYQEMTTAEMRDATKEFDREFVGDTFGPPTPKQRAQRLGLESTLRAPHRPRKTSGNP